MPENKKFLDAPGITHLVRKIDQQHPTNDDLQNVVDAVEEALDEKANSADMNSHIQNTNIHLTPEEKQKLGTRITAYRNASGTLVLSYSLPQ